MLLYVVYIIITLHLCAHDSTNDRFTKCRTCGMSAAKTTTMRRATDLPNCTKTERTKMFVVELLRLPPRRSPKQEASVRGEPSPLNRKPPELRTSPQREQQHPPVVVYTCPPNEVIVIYTRQRFVRASEREREIGICVVIDTCIYIYIYIYIYTHNI